jgi:UDP-N-acetylmuramate dehydrogenase
MACWLPPETMIAQILAEKNRPAGGRYNPALMRSVPPIRHDVSLRELNTFGIDARAHAFVSVKSIDDLEVIAADPQLSVLPRLILGGGSNVLLTKDFNGLVLHMVNRGCEIMGNDGAHTLGRAQAGENWHAFVQWTLAQGLPGLENLSLIPGSVGAAPIQNIGAYGSEVAEFIHSLTLFDFLTGETRVLSREECRFGYRDSIFKHALRDRAVIIDVSFALPRQWLPNLHYAELVTELGTRGVSNPTARDIADAVIAIRRRKLPDPAEIGNAGSFFKNPVVSREQHAQLLAKHPQLVGYPQSDGSIKLAAGWLIEQCGWKGRSMGAAGVHERQALVLVNIGGATGQEILALADRIRADVVRVFGVQLDPEPVVL